VRRGVPTSPRKEPISKGDERLEISATSGKMNFLTTKEGSWAMGNLVVVLKDGVQRRAHTGRSF